MKTTIEVIQRNNDDTDFVKLIVKLLNTRFTTQESMELRWKLNCLDVVQELHGKLIFEENYIIFDFSEVY